MQPSSAQSLDTCLDCGRRKLCPADYIANNPTEVHQRGTTRNAVYAVNETLFMQGDWIKRLFFVKSGSIKNVYTSDDGDQQIIGFYFCGELIVPASLKHSRHLSTTIALETSVVCSFPLDIIATNCEKHSHLQTSLLNRSEAEIKQHHESLLGISQRSALNRVCAFLLDLIYRQRLNHDNSALVQLTMSRADIANYLGLAPETVSRNLAKLKNQGLVTIQKKRLKLVDLKTLERLSN